jgi:hypothetical protein
VSRRIKFKLFNYLFISPPALKAGGAHTIVIFQSAFSCDEAEFMKWKNGIGAAVHSAPPAVSTDVVEKIRHFDLSNATPVECMLFLSEIKKTL